MRRHICRRRRRKDPTVHMCAGQERERRMMDPSSLTRRRQRLGTCSAPPKLFGPDNDWCRLFLLFFSGSWTLFVDAEKTTRSPPTCWNHFVVCLCVGFFYYHFIGSVVWEKERKKEGNFVTLPAFWSESRDGCCCWTVAAHSNNGRDPIRPPLKTNTGQGVRAALFILNRELKIGQRMPLFTTGEKCRIL